MISEFFANPLMIVCAIALMSVIISISAFVTTSAYLDGTFFISVNLDFLSTTVTNAPI